MDLSDVGVRHAVTFSSLNIRHSVDISPLAVSIARELRICVIAIIIGYATTSIVKGILAFRKPPERLDLDGPGR